MLESEYILLERFANNGDAKAFSEIARRHAAMVYGACLRVLGDSNKASDAAQDTFFQLLRSAGKISGSIPAWLHRVATRKAVDVIRRDSARRHREQQYAADKSQQVDKWEDMSQYIDEELSKLDEQLQEVLIRHFFEGQKIEEITTATGLSQSTVYRWIETGVSALRDKLRKKGIIVAAVAFAHLLTENAVQAAPAAVLKELGKMALLTSVSGSVGTAAVSGTGVKATAAVMASVKAKIIAAAAVTAVGVGSVVTYKTITAPEEQPAGQVSQPVEQRRQHSPASTAQRRSAVENTTRTSMQPKERTENSGFKAPWEDFLDSDYTERKTHAADGDDSTGARGGFGAGVYLDDGLGFVAGAEEAEDANSSDANSEESRPRLRGRRRRSTEP